MSTEETEPRAADLAGSLTRLEREFLRPYRRAFLVSLLALLAQSALLLPIPILQGRVLDRLVATAGVEAARSPAARFIGLAVAAMIACHLARAGLSWSVTAATGRISQEVVVALRSALHRKLMRLPMTFFDSNQTGRLMARVTSDVGSILSFVNSGLLQLLNDLLLALGIAFVLAWLEWRLALVALVAVPLYVVNQRRFAVRIRKLSLAIRAQIAAIYALLSERVSAVRVVRSFAKEDAEIETLDRRIDTHRDLSWQNTKVNAYLGVVATLISGAGTVAVLVGGAWLVGQGELTVGDLLAFYSLIGQLYGPIVRLTQFQATAQATTVSVERLFEILDEPETIKDRPGARGLDDGVRGAVEFRDVRFRYRPALPLVLDGVDLRIEPGQTLGITGPSGAGKSTLLALAARMYDLPEGRGSVRFADSDVRDLRLADLRRAVVLVPQQSMLFEGTIRSNLAYADPMADEAALWRALEIADLAATIRAMPLGLEAPVGERGQSLSGGQRQRLALARALVADPSVLLLDDCTSALDAATEARIQDALHAEHRGRTVVIVSHKMSSVRRADRIVVVDGGRIVEEGTHDDLITLGGHYHELYVSQTKSLVAEPA